MSIFSRLRKRDSDDPGAPDASAGAKAPSDSPPAKPAAPAAGKVAPPGMTRAYQAVKPAAPRPPAAATSPAPAGNRPEVPPAVPRGTAARGEDAEKEVRGRVSGHGAAAAMTANAANGELAVNGVLAKRPLDEAAPDQALSAPGSIDLAFESLLTPG